MQPNASIDQPAFPLVIDLPQDSTWEFGVVAQYLVLKHFREVLKWPEAVLRNEDIEAVHQIRVAARRTRTALQTFTPLWPEEEVREFSSQLARFADAFGVSRDLDVMLIYLRAQLETATEERAEAYRWLLARNTELRSSEQPKLEQTLLEFKASGLPERLVTYFSSQPFDLHKMEAPDG